MIKQSLGFSLAAVLALGVVSAYAQEAANAPNQNYDPRNFDGVWHLQGGGGAAGGAANARGAAKGAANPGGGANAGGPARRWGLPFATKDGVRYTVYPFTPQYQAIYDKRIADAAAGNPFQDVGTTCLPSGAIRMLTGGGPPLEFFHTSTKMVIYKENGGWMRIYLNRSQHLPTDQLYPMFYGDSVGHWEGNTLVVDTISIGAARSIDGTAPFSDAAHLIQRISRPAFDTLHVDATLYDPKALTHPISAAVDLKPLPDEDFTESFCQNERNIRDAKGRQTVRF